MTPHFFQSLALVALGGTLGTAAREALVLGMSDAGPLPWAIVTANIVGAFLLGLLLSSLHRTGRPGPSSSTGALGLTQARRRQLLLGTGFCGGFTTYSTLAVSVLTLSGGGSHGVAWAAVHGLGTVFAGALATWAGMAWGTRGSDVEPQLPQPAPGRARPGRQP